MNKITVLCDDGGMYARGDCRKRSKISKRCKDRNDLRGFGRNQRVADNGGAGSKKHVA